MKKFFTSILTCVLLVTMMVTVKPQTVNAGSANEIRNCVAPIAAFLEFADPYTREKLGLMSLGSGTCFFVGKEGSDAQYLVTNYHVAQYYLEYGKGDWIEDTAYIDGEKANVLERVTMRVFLNKNEYVEAYPITSSAYDEARDIAFLRLNNPMKERKVVQFQIPDDSMVTNTVYCVGYPGIAENSYADPVSSWSIEDATIVDGVISRFVTQTGTGTRFIQSTATFSPGHSGSPMVTEEGYVIGMNTSYLSDSGDKVYYSVDARDIMALMDANNIDYSVVNASSSGGSAGSANEAEAGQKAEGNTNTGNEAADTTAPVTPQPLESAKSGTPVWIFALIAIAVIAVVVIVVMSSKKNKAPAQSAAPQAPQAPRPQPQQPARSSATPLVRSLAVQHNGEKVTLKGRQILVGRDASANIRYKEGTPGISGRHCTLSYEESTGDFLLTDLKSTYGTYLSNGQKLQPGQVYRLKAGDSFYLGEKSNELRVELG